MSVGESAKACNSCTKGRWRRFSWLPAIVVAILPKCPFCIMAYAGAIPLCGGSSYYPNAGNTSLYLTLGLALVVLLGILLNHKGRRTWKAGGIALLGISCLALSQLLFISMTLYYIGVSILFFGIWYNGSFSFFQRRIKGLFVNSQFSTKPSMNHDCRKV